MNRRRTPPTVALLALVALAAAGAVRAADELGATVESRLYVSESRTLHVYNRSTIPATFTPQASDGWTFEPASLTLDPETQGTFTLLGEGSDATATIVSVTAAYATPAMDASVLQFPATIHLERPFDPGPLLIFIPIAALVALFSVARLRRVRA